MNQTLISVILASVFLLMSCNTHAKQTEDKKIPKRFEKDITLTKMPALAPDWQLENYLTNAEKAEGYILLFDGKTSAGWRAYNQSSFPNNWIVDNGTLHVAASNSADKKQKINHADIVYESEFSDFILKLEWKISPLGDSGIFYLGKEQQDNKAFDYLWQSAPEMQITNRANSAKANDLATSKQESGALQDLIPPKYKNTVEAGQWNQVEIHVKNRVVKHIQNGKLVVQYKLDTPEWEALVHSSKFSASNLHWHKVPTAGYIGLQDQGDAVWFRNIKLKPLEK